MAPITNADDILQNVTKVNVYLFQEEFTIAILPAVHTGLYLKIEYKNGSIRKHRLDFKPRRGNEFFGAFGNVPSVVSLGETAELKNRDLICVITDRFKDLAVLINGWFEETSRYRLLGYNCHRWTLDRVAQLMTHHFIGDAHEADLLTVVHLLGDIIQGERRYIGISSDRDQPHRDDYPRRPTPVQYFSRARPYDSLELNEYGTPYPYPSPYVLRQ